jgi:hypothetical protein
MRLIFGILLIGVLNCCDVDNFLKQAEDKTSFIVDSLSFSAIAVNGLFDVELIQDSVKYFEVFGYEHILKDVEISSVGDTIELYNNFRCLRRKNCDRPKIKIHFNDIDRIDVTEAVYLYSSDTITDNFQITMRSNISEADLIFNNQEVYFIIYTKSGGRYNLSGKTDYLYILNFYTGLFDASNLASKTALIQNYSIVDMKVNATNELTVGIYNSGNILFRGNPTITVEAMTSTGKAIPLLY